MCAVLLPIIIFIIIVIVVVVVLSPLPLGFSQVLGWPL